MKSNDWRHKNVARYTPGNTKILYFFNCLLDGMHTIGGNGFVCSSLNELNSNPLTFCSILFIVRILIRLTEVSGMNHMKYETLIADRLGNSCLDAGFFISDKIIFYPISLIRSNFKSLLSHVLKKMFFQTCSKERKIKL